MSRAFVKESDGDEVPEGLPDRPISTHPNFVTKRGLRLIDEELERLRTSLSAVQESNDRAAIAALSRDLRYWTARRASAQLVSPPDDNRVRFGTTVTIVHADGARQRFTIVGEDEADPAKSLISHASAMAQALMGAAVGEVVEVPHGGSRSEAEVVEVRRAPSD